MSGQNAGSPIVTLTPAPTLDRTYFVTNLHSGAVNRADDVGEELAGKGIKLVQFHVILPPVKFCYKNKL